MSQAVTRSTAPPMTPPCTAASTGTRAFSSAVNDHCRTLALERIRARSRPSSPSPPARWSSLNTDRSMPALKCLPVLLMTTTRALASSLMAVTISGQLAPEVGGHGVELVRAGQPHVRDLVGDLDVEAR